MHEAIGYLAKRVKGAEEALEAVLEELRRQLQREQKTLEQAVYGDEFDAEQGPIQERVVAVLQEVIERLEEASEAVEASREALVRLPEEL